MCRDARNDKYITYIIASSISHEHNAIYAHTNTICFAKTRDPAKKKMARCPECNSSD